VIQALHRLQHALAGGGRHHVRLGEHAGDGGGGDARPAGDVGDVSHGGIILKKSTCHSPVTLLSSPRQNPENDYITPCNPFLRRSRGRFFTRWRAGMTRQHQPGARYSRRDFGKLALAGLALPSLAGSRLLAAGSKINGVQIGAITYSFRSIPDADAMLKAMAQLGLSEAELMA